MKKITIYEVAKEAGVSLATVSRVINGSSVVREETKQRVEEVIARLGYKPNAIAQGLAIQKTTTIALIISDDSIYNTGQTLSGLTDVAKVYKYNISLHTISEGVNSVTETVESVIKNRADGAIVFGDKFNEDQIKVLSDFGIPVVVVGNKEYSDTKSITVQINFERMAYELTKKYLTAGKTNLAFVEDRKNKPTTAKIVNGIEKAFEEHGLTFTNLIEIPKEYRSSYDYLQPYFKDHTYDAVFAFKDSQAIAVLNSIKEAGTIDNIELVCLVDSRYNTMVRPQISGFKIPQYDLGAVAMRVITKMLATEEDEEAGFDPKIELGYLYMKRKTTKE